MIFFPLPGLRRILVALGERDPELAQRVITEASETIGQKRPARFALAELQARSLEIAARERLYARTGELALDFIPTASAPANLVLLFTPFTPFQLAARELLAAQGSGSHDHKKRALARARKTIKDNQLSTISGPPRAADLALYRYLPRAHRAWLAIIDEEQARLSRDMRERPQDPTPFVAGPALGPDDQSLFKGRKDLVRLIDHDLTADRRAPLLLCGQRRMGKSSLLRMLPIQLGTGTRVVTLNFQSLSGSPHRAAPHLWLSQKIAAVVPNIPAPPQDHAWMPTLEWLRKIDAALAARDERLLVAIDEVERLQDGIEAGWASTDLLDLIRAAGDQLTRIRMLFVSAHPLPRLGPHWVDRLISVVQREIGYLDPDAACELVCHPTDTFPDIYPDGGADHIVRETRCHPYLIQLVCDELCRGLNEAGRLRATDDDIDLAIERAFAKTTLFDELWRHLDDDEHAWLRRLARALDGLAPPEQTDQALRRLIRERYVEQRDGAVQVAVPMFATWIRSERG